jgi:hypothetical protein
VAGHLTKFFGRIAYLIQVQHNQGQIIKRKRSHLSI